MFVRFLPLGALLFALLTGCNTAQKDAAPAEAAHDHDDHAGHEHGHDGHGHGDHAGHEHGEHDHAEIKDFHQAADMIQSARDTIRDSLAAGEIDKADEALHSLGHTLEHVGELTSDFTDEVRSEIKKDVDELLDLFGKVDEQIHAKQTVTYDTWSEKIDAAVERLHERAHEEPAKEEPAKEAAPE